MTQVIEAPAQQPVEQDVDDTLVITVAQRHISMGQRRQATGCAVALALREAGHTNVSVAGPWIYVAGGKRWKAPAELVEWIDDFDHFLPVYPERFVLTKRCSS